MVLVRRVLSLSQTFRHGAAPRSNRMRTLAPRARPQILAHRQLQTRTYADDKRGKDAEGTFTEYKPSQDGFADEESAEDVVAEATSTEGISLHGIPADENEQDEWIVKQERMKMIELAKKLRAKSIHLKNLRTYANEELLKEGLMSDKDRGKAEELVRRTGSEGEHIQTLFVQLAGLLDVKVEELYAMTSLERAQQHES